ncbi:hypothetical protein HERIO_1635 [Hepatospora eriocheir]|uniref:Uncharacterized protein n=1 Tax=Hepatospora eriocheir TaxID=1081669 RepID=A0A1X0Q9G6_9MICR|nr:hypothetical protein HERIO_1635 [Hepatospora eriocheir]
MSYEELNDYLGILNNFLYFIELERNLLNVYCLKHIMNIFTNEIIMSQVLQNKLDYHLNHLYILSNDEMIVLISKINRKVPFYLFKKEILRYYISYKIIIYKKNLDNIHQLLLKHKKESLINEKLRVLKYHILEFINSF